MNTETLTIDPELNKKIDHFFPLEVEEEIKVEESNNDIAETKVDVSEDSEEQKIEEEVKEIKDEDEKEITENEEMKELNRKLSGHPKEFKELVKSVSDPELQSKILEAGKVVRAREDRLSLELGNLKKEYSNVTGLLKFLDTDPAEAIKHIAKVTKVDLEGLVAKPVQETEEYDYRTPEEIAKDKKLTDIERELKELKNQKAQEELATINQEIEIFIETKDEDGELKYPHFAQLESSIFDILGIEKQKLGSPKNAKERKERLERAYQKAMLLDDDLRAKRDEEILKKVQERKAAEIEKAKKLKKFSGKSFNANIKPDSERAVISAIFDQLASINS